MHDANGLSSDVVADDDARQEARDLRERPGDERVSTLPECVFDAGLRSGTRCRHGRWRRGIPIDRDETPPATRYARHRLQLHVQAVKATAPGLDPGVEADSIILFESVLFSIGQMECYPKLRQRGVVTIPEEVRDGLELEEGDQLKLTVEKLD
ncbi:MAG: AbrB/MazE/SpoVT family DNA-binding domain-containing protein [Haloarculaceae archaeon]